VNHRIFLAEDELNVRQTLRLFLEQAGYDIVGEASDAENLLAQVCVSPPGVIMLDWELPGLRAPHLLPALRNNCPGTKVVALSARPEARQPALVMGADAFVSKGSPSDELLAVLHLIAAEDQDQKGGIA
jgi:DNA-binding NarL/FixJ family response regulator